jgi:hypothetical protein
MRIIFACFRRAAPYDAAGVPDGDRKLIVAAGDFDGVMEMWFDNLEEPDLGSCCPGGTQALDTRYVWMRRATS